MHLGFGRNEYGTQISRHRCDVCGVEFTLCPAQVKDDTCGRPPHIQGGCTSYDPARDVDRMLDGGAELIAGPTKPEVS